MAEDNPVVAGTDRGISLSVSTRGKKDIRFITTRDGLSDNIVTTEPGPPEKQAACWHAIERDIAFDLAKGSGGGYQL